MRRNSRASADSAAAFVPDDLPDAPAHRLTVLADAASACRGCELCDIGTQTVFGEGPADAPLMFVGEQPGDQEDRHGRPFIGPAGQLFDELLREAGLDRDAAYVTNAVKHFRHEPRGKLRYHRKPTLAHATACQPWLEQELAAVRPRVLVCLGSTAAQQVISRTFRITQSRGEVRVTPHCGRTLATYHPSALLRASADRAPAMRADLVADLALAASLLNDPPPHRSPAPPSAA
jgi:DNA polymerase